MGSITYGQSKDLLIPVSPKLVSNCEFTLTYDIVQEKKKSLRFNVKNSSQRTDPDLITRHKLRLEFVHCVRTTFEGRRETKTKSTITNLNREEVNNQIKTFENEMRKHANGNDEFIKDLLTDLTGQVQEAIEREDWFKKWGIHYLPSLTRKLNQINIRQLTSE